MGFHANSTRALDGIGIEVRSNGAVAVLHIDRLISGVSREKWRKLAALVDQAFIEVETAMEAVNK